MLETALFILSPPCQEPPAGRYFAEPSPNIRLPEVPLAKMHGYGHNTHVAGLLFQFLLWDRSSSDILPNKVCWEAIVAS